MAKIPFQGHPTLTIIILLLAVAGGLGRYTEQQFYLGSSDKLCLNIDNFLPSQHLLNDLEVIAPPELEAIIPRNYNIEALPDFMPQFDKPISIIHASHFGKFISLLIREETQHWVVIKEVDMKTKQSNTEKLPIASMTDECTALFIDEANAYTACFSNFEKNFQFCSLNYIDRENSKCQPFSFNLRETELLEKASVGLDFYNGPGGNKLFALYFTKIDFVNAGQPHGVRRQFYLTDLETQSLMILHDDVEIVKVSIAAYNKSTKEVVLLIMVEEKGVRSLRQYSVVDSAFVELSKDQWYRPVKDKISDFGFKDRTLVTAMEVEGQPVVITNIDLNDSSSLDFPLEGQVSLRRMAGSASFFAFETQDTDGKAALALFDTRNHRFLKVPNFNQANEPLQWLIVPIGFSEYFFQFRPTEARVFELQPFQDVCIRAGKGLGNKQKAVEFRLRDALIFKALITTAGFDFIKNDNIVSKGVFISDAQTSEQLIHLNVRGNDLSFAENSPVYFFHPAERLQDDDAEADEVYCPVAKALIKNRSLVTLCDSGRVVVNKDFWLDRTSKQYSFELRKIFETKLDISRVQMIRLLFGEFLVMVDAEKNLFYLGLEGRRKGSEVRQNDILVDFDACISEKHRFVCKSVKDEVFIIETSKNGEQLEFVEQRAFYLPNAVFNSIVVSAFDPKTLYYIRESFHRPGVFHLIREVDSVARKVNIGQMRISMKSTLIEIAESELVVIDESDEGEPLTIYGLIGSSQVTYPFAHIATLNFLIDYAVVEEAKVFCLLYKTIDGEVFLYVARSSLEVYDRVIRDQRVGPFEEGMALEAHFITKFIILFFVYNKNSTEGQYSFIYFINSPMYSLAPDAPIKSVVFGLNGRNYIQPLEQIAADTELKVAGSPVNINDLSAKQLFFDLEKKGELAVSGDLMEAYEVGPAPGLTFVPRLKHIARHNVKKAQQGLDSNANISLAIEAGSFVLFFDDFFFKNDEEYTNRRFNACKAVGLTSDDPALTQLFFCHDQQTSRMVLTNHSGIAIGLEGLSHKSKKLKVIKVKSDLFVAALNGPQRLIYFFKFVNVEGEFKLEFTKRFAANDFGVETGPIDDFFMFDTLLPDRIVFLLHQAFQPAIVKKEFDRTTNLFDKQASETIALRDEAEVNVNELFCIAEQWTVSCLIRGDRFIFDTQLVVAGGRISLKVNTRYPFAESYFIESKLNYSVTPKYLGVLTKNSERGYDGLVFRRDFGARVNKVFGAVKVKGDERIARIGLVDGPGQGPSRLFVALFFDAVDTSTFYRNLVVDEYQLGPFGLDIARDSAGYRRTLELNFVSRDNDIKKVYLNVVLNSNFKNYMLTIVLLILIAVLVGLVMAVVSIYHRNRKLRMEVDPNIADQSAFVNRTQFQI